MESTLETRRKDTPAFVQQPVVLNFGDLKKSAVDMVIEEYDDQEGGEGKEVEDHTQGEHITRVALPTAPEQEAKRGKQRKATPASTDNHLVRIRNQGAFQRFPESVEEEAAVTEQVQERIPKVEKQRKATPASTDNHLLRTRNQGQLQHLHANSIEEEDEEEEEDDDEMGHDVCSANRDFTCSQTTTLPEKRGRKATPAVATNYTCGMREEFRQFRTDSIEEETEEEQDQENTLFSSQTTTLPENRGRKATPAVVTNFTCGMGDQFRQFRAVSIEEEEENDQENTLSSSQDINQSQEKSRKSTPAIVASYACRMAGPFQHLRPDGIEEETEEDEDEINESNASNSVACTSQVLSSTCGKSTRRATPAITANYPCGLVGKLRQFQADSIEEETGEVKDHVTGSPFTGLAIPGEFNLDSEGSPSLKRKVSSVEAPSIDQVNSP